MKATHRWTLHSKTAMSASFLALASNLPAAHAQTTDTWSLGGSGLWNVAGNWSADVVPNNGTPSGSTYNVGITDGISTVTLNINPTIDDLSLGAGNTLVIPTGASLTLLGPTVANAGSIQINGGNGAYSYLVIGGNTTLSGAGSVTLSTVVSGGGDALIEPNGSAATLTNQSTIQGAGTIGNGNGGLTVANSGTINANSSGQALALNGASVTNTGTLEATGGGELALETGVVNSGGNITASGAGSTVYIDGVSISGGTLTTKAGGVLQTAGTNTLTNVTLAAGTLYPIADGTETILSGSLTNNGSILVNGGNGNYGYLVIGSNLTSNGPVTLSTLAASGGNAFIEPNGSAVTLTNTSTIQGSGTIGNGNGGLTVVNGTTGIIDADATGSGQATQLLLNGSGITNTGTLKATSGATLTIDTNVVNTGGNITSSGTGSIVSFDGVSITGGTVTTKSGGVLQTAGTNTLTNVTLAPGTLYPIADGTETILSGTLANNGGIQVNGGNGNYGYLVIGSNLTSNGPVTLSTLASGGGTAFLEPNGAAQTLTNTSTIQGSGTVGNGNGGLTVVNSTTGIIDANATGTGQITQLLLNGSSVTNSGLIEATNGNTLVVDTNVVNNGGNIVASGAGSIVSLEGVSITGGALTTSGGGILQTSGTNTLTNVTLAAGTIYPVADGSTTILEGTLTNNGGIQVNGGNGNYGYLIIGSNLTSNGPITLSTVVSGGGTTYIEPNGAAETLSNKNIIQGGGVIGNGNGGLTLVNEATGIIDANVTGSGLGTQLLLDGAGITNAGLLEATNGNTLVVDTSVANSGGKITSSGAGSIVSLEGVSITGGTLTASGGGILQTSGTNTLDNVTIAAGTVYPVGDGSTTIIDGTLANNGNIQINGGNGNYAYLVLGNSFTSNGVITLATGASGGSAYIEPNGSAATLTNTGTIQGAGIIGNGNGGLTVVNGTTGTIDANATGSGVPNTLSINGSGLTNLGTLQVASGDVLHVSNGPFTNFSGTTLTGGTYSIGGTLEIDELGSNGGEIVTNAANIILNGSSASFVDSNSGNALSSLAVNAATGSFSLVGGSNFTTAGNFTNNGTLGVGGGSTFAVTGSLTNFAGTTLTGGTYDVTGELEFPGANIVTNAANIALTGSAAQIVNSTTSSSGLANFATNSATGTFSVLGGLGFTTSGSFTNNGTLIVGSGSTFAVAPAGSLTNFAGTTLTGGTYDVTGTLEFAGANVVTNAANITLTGSAAQIENSTTSGNGLANLDANAAKSSFTLAGGANFTTAGTFSNSGTLSVGAGSTFDVSGKLENFSSTTSTLTAGTYDVTGTLEFPKANIVTNDASITLASPTAEIENSTTSTNGLANLATNAAKGTIGLAGAANLTTSGNFSTAGTVSIGTGSTFTVGGPGVYTQTAGTTSDKGTLAASGGLTLSGGSLFANGTIAGNLNSTGLVTPGTGATKVGVLTDVGTYTQNSGGSLDIDIAGTTAGTKFDVLNATKAVLAGTLNITTGYTPTVGSTFKIVNFGSETGTFATVNGQTINSTEAYTVTYQPTDVLLTVVSTGEAVAAAETKLVASTAVASQSGTAERERLGEALREFNASYAQGGKVAVAAANNEMIAKRRVAERFGALSLVKAHH